MKYLFNDKPKCPHCDSDFDIHNDPSNEYFEEGDIILDCENCEKEYKCEVIAQFVYSTDDQEED